jgi:hypothetical protein
MAPPLILFGCGSFRNRKKQKGVSMRRYKILEGIIGLAMAIAAIAILIWLQSRGLDLSFLTK